jgi:NADPH2:quinone reductase
VSLNRVLLKNIALVGLHWGAHQQHDPARIPQAMRELFALYARGLVTPLVSSQYPLARAAEALEEIAERRSVGKVLLIP